MEEIVNNLIKATGWSILHSLWQGALIYALLFVVLMTWSKSSAKLKHNLSFSALLLMLTSFLYTFFSIFRLPTLLPSASELNLIQTQQFAQLSNSFHVKTETYFPVVAGIYALGLIFQLFVLSKGYLKLKQLKKSNALAIPTAWEPVFMHTLEQLKINKTVKFFLSAKVNVPLVIGFFKPVILFPIALATQLDLKQVESILVHELSHVRRNDYLINLVKTCIETLLFFNPFVWLTTRHIQIEREHACDDLVVTFTGAPLSYAQTLLKLEILKEKETPALSLAAVGKNQHLYQRIKRITDMKTNYLNAKQQFLILSLSIATILSLAWISPNKKETVKSKPTKSLTVLKTTPFTAKDLKEELTAKADTDTVKKNKKRQKIYYNNGNTIIYNSIDELPDSIQEKIRDIDKRFNSPEWKEKMAKIDLSAKEMEQKFNSPEWKEKMAKIELSTKEMEKKFNSPEWKEKMAKIDLNAKEIEKKFNSPEWKEKMAKIDLNAKEIEKKFNSSEWKAQMAHLELSTREIARKFKSPEWRASIGKIELKAKELEEKFNSPEWKAQIEEIRKFEQSQEFKDLRKKYENDIEELRKKKGIKID